MHAKVMLPLKFWSILSPIQTNVSNMSPSLVLFHLVNAKEHYTHNQVSGPDV